MKQVITASAALAILILLGSTDLAAQHQMGGQTQMGSQAGQQDQPMGQQPMMGTPMMEMMCPMMSGGMMPHMMGSQMGRSAMGMMGMMGGGQADPKTVGRMLQLRGEILKAVGDVLIKHGKAMEEAR